MPNRDDHSHNGELDDRTIRLIGVPTFGIVIPNLSGLFGKLQYQDVAYWAGYLYFILLAYLIWQGNRYLLFRTRQRFTWFDKPVEKLILLLVNNVFYTAPLTVAWLCIWYRFAGFPSVDWDAIRVVVLINVICVLFVTHVYETVFMVREQQGEQLRNADLSRAKAEAELAALKNQVDPHFMFNSLNSLSYLISKDQPIAQTFTENLAEVYRYILSQKDRALVMLEDELAFTDQYAALLHLRFGEALQFKPHLNGGSHTHFLIPPTSVFVAIENAVKHNEVSEQHPLTIELLLQGKTLVVRNEIRLKRNMDRSPGIGLKNLDERFKLTTGHGIYAGTYAGELFEVRMPLIPVGDVSDKENER